MGGGVSQRRCPTSKEVGRFPLLDITALGIWNSVGNEESLPLGEGALPRTLAANLPRDRGQEPTSFSITGEPAMKASGLPRGCNERRSASPSHNCLYDDFRGILDTNMASRPLPYGRDGWFSLTWWSHMTSPLRPSRSR